VIVDRIQNESYRLTCLKVICTICLSPLDKKYTDFSAVFNKLVAELSGFLRKAHRQLRLSSLQCLDLLFKRYDTLPAEIDSSLLSDLKALLSESDLHVVSKAISVISQVIRKSGSSAQVTEDIKSDLVPRVIQIAEANPHLLLARASEKSLSDFWAAIIDVGGPSFSGVCLDLVFKLGTNDPYTKQV
jgi:cullin-associated NEDD8-dissociated protein 1